jgi:hypothetical protein
MPHVMGFPSQKTADNKYEYFDFPTVGKTFCRDRTAINKPVAGNNRRERGRCVDS